MKVIAATHNKSKICEFKDILGTLGFDVISQNDIGINIEPEENGKTFAENALIKARAIAALCDYAVIADDSGLCVDALNDAPGVYSARYAGENANDNTRMEKLLSELDGITNRKAKFISTIAFIFPNKEEIVTYGEVCGKITDKIYGNNGFGYDPIFFSDELGKTFGEACSEEKNNISHRARGLMALYNVLSQKTNNYR